jgi:hypothetical protein
MPSTGGRVVVMGTASGEVEMQTLVEEQVYAISHELPGARPFFIASFTHGSLCQHRG